MLHPYKKFESVNPSYPSERARPVLDDKDIIERLKEFFAFYAEKDIDNLSRFGAHPEWNPLARFLNTQVEGLWWVCQQEYGRKGNQYCEEQRFIPPLWAQEFIRQACIIAMRDDTVSCEDCLSLLP